MVCWIWRKWIYILVIDEEEIVFSECCIKKFWMKEVIQNLSLKIQNGIQ